MEISLVLRLSTLDRRFVANKFTDQKDLQMPNRPMPYCDDSLDPGDYQPEVIPTAANPRTPLSPPKANVAETAYTKTGQKFAERVVEAHNTGRPLADHITADQVPQGLIRLMEAADAAPNENVSNMSAGTIKSISTGLGDVLVVDVRLSVLSLCPDPVNGRTIAAARARQLPHLSAIADDEFGFPLFDVASVGQLRELVTAAQSELGFDAPIVAPGKDYADLVSIGLQGVHEPLLVTPTRYRTPDGATAYVFKVDDGNRREAALRRALLDATGGSSWSQVESWSDHFERPGAASQLCDQGVDSVNTARTKALFNDFRGGVMSPSSMKEEDVAFFLREKASRSIRLRTILRCRTVPVRLVVGVNTATLTSHTAAAPSITSTLVSEVVRRLHISESAQKPWSDETQNLQCALVALEKLKERIGAGADYLPLDAATAQAVIDNKVADWTASPDDESHPLRVATLTLATILCDDHDGKEPVRAALKAFNFSVHGSKIAENRARIGAEVIMSVLGQGDSSKPKYKQLRTVIERVSRHRVLTDVPAHPDGKTSPWWEMVNLPLSELHQTAKTEIADRAAMSDADREALDKGAGGYGPATRALLAMATVAQTANPAVVAYPGRVGASPYQLTINGLGGTRGVTLTTPDQVMLRLCNDQCGVDQLAEIISAAVATPPRVAANVIDPTDEDEHDPSTRGLLREAFLRGTQMGWTSDGGAGTPSPPTRPDVYDQYRAIVQRMIASIDAAATEARKLLEPRGSDEDEPSLQSVFRESGIEPRPTAPVTGLINELHRVFTLGEAYAQ